MFKKTMYLPVEQSCDLYSGHGVHVLQKQNE